jgi:hypothetical protein
MLKVHLHLNFTSLKFKEPRSEWEITSFLVMDVLYNYPSIHSQFVKYKHIHLHLQHLKGQGFAPSQKKRTHTHTKRKKQLIPISRVLSENMIRHSVSEQIPLLLMEPEETPPSSKEFVSHTNPARTHAYFYNIHPNIFRLSTPKSHKRPPFYCLNFCMHGIPRVLHVPPISYSFHHLNNS